LGWRRRLPAILTRLDETWRLVHAPCHAQFLDGLDARRQRYRELQHELDARVPAHNGV